MKNATLISNLYDKENVFDDLICIQTNDRFITYSEIKINIDNVAGYFHKSGISDGDRVVIVNDNSIDYVVALYAVWRAGCVVVALNPQSTVYEVEKIIHQCKAKALISNNLTSSFFHKLNNKSIHLLSFNSCDNDKVYKWDDALNNETETELGFVSPDSSAQIIYTSGTTGNPKGVLLTHHNLIINTLDIVSYLKLTSKDSVLNVLPFHYSYGNSVLHTHLYVGAKIILDGSMAFPQEIVNNLRKYCPSGFYGVPSTYNLLLSRSNWSEDPPQLRYITQAGGPMSETLTNKLIDSLYLNTELFVMYGQTEATARITWLPPKSLKEKIGSVGIALDNLKIEIRSSKGLKLCPNIKGNVYVFGGSVMDRYWGNAQETNKTLIDGWLKTGDIGYLDEDGYLYLQGRKNDMIKVGAHRINPLELEEVINKLDFIDESAVIGIDDEMLGQKLRAFVVGDESKINLFALKKHCNEFLPAHKIPRDIKWLSDLPKTPSGKIKRFELN